MKKIYCMIAQVVLLLWFFLDMTGLYFGDKCLVTRSYKEDGIFFLIYLAALYAFVKVSFAIKDIFSNKIERFPVIVATFCVKLANALVAIIFLESSMLAEFGSNSEGERVLLLISGCSVALIILLLSVYISKHAGKYHS